MRDVGAFVALSSERYGSEIWTVCLEEDSVKRNFLDRFGNGGFLIGEDAADADVPVSEPFYLAVCLYLCRCRRGTLL